MAEGKEQSAAESSSKGSFVKIAVMALLFGLLLVGASVGTTMMMINSGHEKESGKDNEKGDKANKKKEDKHAEKTIFFELDPPFVVNFSNPGRIRFMQVAVQVSVGDPAVIERIKEYNPVIRNNLLLLLGSQNSDELRTREGKEKLRGQVLSEIQAILKERTGKAGVKEVFFTSLVMQ